MTDRIQDNANEVPLMRHTTEIVTNAIIQMVRLGNELNWDPPIDQEFVDGINDLKEFKKSIQPTFDEP